MASGATDANIAQKHLTSTEMTEMIMKLQHTWEVLDVNLALEPMKCDPLYYAI